MSMLKSSMVKEAHENGLLVVPWTLNSVEDYQAAEAMEVDGIATDDPCAAREFFFR
jgi:glycerophosphoryl diester phosphodiesterase